MSIPPHIHPYLPAIIHTCQRNPQEETCGLIDLSREKVIVSQNLADDPTQGFKLDPEIQALALTTNAVVWHSHLSGQLPYLSHADVIAAKEARIPYLMFHTHGQKLDYFDPKEIPPYIGRPWNFIRSNCYTLVQDYYKREFNIPLKDFYLSHPLEFSDPEFSTFLANVEQVGFVPLQPSEPWERGDFILFSIGHPQGVPNHCGVIWSPEENTFLNQMIDRHSEIRSLTAAYRKIIWRVYRHAARL